MSSSSKGEQNTERSAVTGASPELENEPLSGQAPDDSAGKRGHGAHGARGPGEHVDESLSKPDMSRGSDRGGSGAWGGAASGGSVIDKRGPTKGG
jgi:hypothetical protein